MKQFLKFIAFVVLAFALWHTAGSAFNSQRAAESIGVDWQDTGACQLQQDAVTASPRLPYLLDAELVGVGGAQTHLFSYSRVQLQRAQTSEYLFFLKGWVGKLAQRMSTLSLHREKLYDATTCYRCQPVCKYYVYTLRRILI